MSFFIDHKLIEPKVLFPGISASIVHSDSITISRVHLEDGTVLPEHHHPHEQWTHVISGELELTVGGETQLMLPGHTAWIPSDTPHSGRVIRECIVLDIFNPPREDLK